MNIDIYSLLCWIVIIIAAAVLVFSYVRKILRWSENNHSEVVKYELTITERKDKYALLGASPASGLSKEVSPRRYYLTGETADGKVVKCQVPYNVYDRAKEGRRVLLTMQGERFIAFERLGEAAGDE